jgi:calcium permeable stress-gated cation channel
MSATIHERHRQRQPLSGYDNFWETTSGGSTFFTSGGTTYFTSAGSTFFSSSGVAVPTSFTSVDGSPVTSSAASQTAPALSGSQTTFSGSGQGGSGGTSTRNSLTSDPSSTIHLSSTSSNTLPPATQTIVQNVANGGPVCIGDGLDAEAGGLVATLLLPTVIGLLLWVSMYTLVITNLGPHRTRMVAATFRLPETSFPSNIRAP